MEVRKVFKAGNSSVVIGACPSQCSKRSALRTAPTYPSNSTAKSGNHLKPVVVKNGNVSIDFVRLVDKLLSTTNSR
jgi:hypothetical protein